MNNHSYLKNPPGRSESGQTPMTRNSRWLRPWLKLGLGLLPLLAIALFSQSAFSIQKEGKKDKEQKEQKQKKGQSETAMLAKQGVESRKVPEGATVSGNSVTLQSGYKFVKQANGSIAVQRANGGVSGEFKCSCKKSATTQGSCDFSTIGGTTATCNNSGCNDCLLETVVKGGKIAAVKAGNVIKKQQVVPRSLKTK